MARLGGTISIKVDGEIYNAVGNFTYNLGQPLRAGLVGPDGVHGYSETPQIPFIEGEIRDRREISLETLQNLTDATVTLIDLGAKMIGHPVAVLEEFAEEDQSVVIQEANDFLFRHLGTGQRQ